MNDKFTNNMKHDDEATAQKINQIAEQTHINGQFAAELEERLRNAHQPKVTWFTSSFKQVYPILRWVALMILLAVVLSWSIKTLIPVPQPAINGTPSTAEILTPVPDIIIDETATSTAEDGGYDFRGAKLYLEQSLPESPDQAYVYLLQEDEMATAEEARAFADRFGIQGEMYTAPGLVNGTTNYVISNGRQFLQIHSDRYFTYTSDMAKNNRNSNGTPSDSAEATIREFLNTRGFDFAFSVYADQSLGGYIVQQLSPDFIPMQYESFSQRVMHVTLDENDEVISLHASLMDYDPNPVGKYGIIDAHEALQRLLDDNILAGKMEFSHSPWTLPQTWYRDYPDNQTVTIHGNVTSNPSTDPNKPALILIDGVPAVGNTDGMDSLDYYTFVEAKGQYLIEDEIRKFNVESWNTNVQSSYVTGTLHLEGDEIILTSDDGGGNRYPLIDPPADVPLDTKTSESQLSLEGVIVDERMDWRYISYFADVSRSGGGGGGGGLGFYQLNLSGTLVPFPSPTSQPEANQGTGDYTVQEGDTLNQIAQNFGISVDELMQANGMTDPMIFVGQTLVIPGAQPNPLIGKRFEDQRGIFIVNIYRKPDGSQRKEYSFAVANENENYYLLLEGDNLEELEKYHNRPVNIWATIESAGQFGNLTAKVDRFEVPFPELPIQILKGTQKVQDIEGNAVLTFLDEDGTTYVQLGPAGDVWDENSMFGKESDNIFVESLSIPDETFAGFPTLRTFSVNYVIDPTTGQANEMIVTADQPYIMDEVPNAENYIPPSLTIDVVELVYFVSNRYYQVNDPNYSQRSAYIQPAWHFHGRYEDGNEFDVLIQALKQEFLLPEIAPGLSPG